MARHLLHRRRVRAHNRPPRAASAASKSASVPVLSVVIPFSLAHVAQNASLAPRRIYTVAISFSQHSHHTPPPAPGGGSWRLHRRVARGTESRVGGQRPRAVAVAPCVPFLDARKAHPRIAVVALVDRWFAVRFAVQ